MPASPRHAIERCGGSKAHKSLAMEEGNTNHPGLHDGSQEGWKQRDDKALRATPEEW
ncbi:MAG: hypothetical protein ACE5JX_04255 [Acidobacteriota bacterium]